MAHQPLSGAIVWPQAKLQIILVAMLHSGDALLGGMRNRNLSAEDEFLKSFLPWYLAETCIFRADLRDAHHPEQQAEGELLVYANADHNRKNFPPWNKRGSEK